MSQVVRCKWNSGAAVLFALESEIHIRNRINKKLKGWYLLGDILQIYPACSSCSLNDFQSMIHDASGVSHGLLPCLLRPSGTEGLLHVAAWHVIPRLHQPAVT
jgi:hypothetical protein